MKSRLIRGKFDGEHLLVTDKNLSSDVLVIHVDHSTFSTPETTFELPKVFSPLLINEKTSKRARRYCRRLLTQKFVVPAFIKNCLIFAAEKGLQKAEETLEKLVRERPLKGQLRVYRHILTTGFPSSDEVDVTNGEKAFTIQVPPKVAERYPVNPYSHTEDINITLDKREWQIIKQKLADFFNLLLIFSDIGDYVRNDTLNKIKEAYFSDQKRAEKLIKKFSKLAKQRRERDEIYDKIQTQQAVEFSDGFLVGVEGYETPWQDRGLYFVTRKGKIYKIYITSSPRQQIYKIVKKGIEGTTLMEHQPQNETMVVIASALKEVAPELAVVIIP